MLRLESNKPRPQGLSRTRWPLPASIHRAIGPIAPNAPAAVDDADGVPECSRILTWGIGLKGPIVGA
jgi:hypothetical protein